MQESIEHLKLFYVEKQQRISFLPKENLLVRVDKSKLKQVFINIISNAIKYTPDGGEVKILLLPHEKDVEVKIIDNGIGIPAEDVSRVFERFYRVDKGRSRQQGGTGLGLSIAQDIVHAHDGEIVASSKLGEGSEFTIRLPLVK